MWRLRVEKKLLTTTMRQLVLTSNCNEGSWSRVRDMVLGTLESQYTDFAMKVVCRITGWVIAEIPVLKMTVKLCLGCGTAEGSKPAIFVHSSLGALK